MNGARTRAGLGLGLVAFLLVACDAGRGNPFASFETRCAQLPTSHFRVSAVPITYAEDDSQSIDQLTVKSGHTPSRHLTFGLTTVQFGHQTEFEIRSVEDVAGARACGTLDVDVRLSMQPMMLYLAQELGGSPCAHTATLEHEMKHVAVFREVLDEAVRDLAVDLPAAIGAGLQRAGSQAELKRQINARVSEHLSEFMHRRKRALDERQDDVDSPEEHARVKDACAQ